MKPLSSLLASVGLASVATAQLVQYTPPDETGVSYSVNIPDTSASTGSGDIFFQIQAPASKQWVALGQGGQMEGANIFVIYSDASGSNITLSPRLGKGPVEPDFNSQAQVSLLGGSGIANGVMTANVRCSSCVTWDGGQASLTSSKSSWLWAVKEGSPLKSNSQSADIQQHTNMDVFNLDLTKARGGSSLNPFLTEAAATGSASNGAAAPVATAPATGTAGSAASSSTASSSSSDSDGDDDDDDSGDSDNLTTINNSIIAHGVIMALAFVIVYPAGALTIRLLSSPHLVFIHAAIQIFAYILCLTGLGLGVYVAVKPVYQLNNYHSITGLVVLILLLAQPVLGSVHHRLYARNRTPNYWGQAHVWWGRLLITLGIINGGLGLRFAADTTKGEIAYGVIAGVVWVGWVGVVVWDTFFRRKGGKWAGGGGGVERKAEEGSGSGSVDGNGNGNGVRG